jgi:DNA-binding NarL/FixJ family response regulator
MADATGVGPIRLVIVDDHAIVRQGLRSILEREPDIEVVGEAASAAEALDLVAVSRPHIVLLDLKLSAGSDVAGLTLCGQLTARPPRRASWW